MESAQHMKVYDGKQSFVWIETHLNGDFCFASSDLVRELCDFSEIAVVPHDLKEAEQHFKKVQWKLITYSLGGIRKLSSNWTYLQALDYHLFDAKKKRMLITMETCKRLKGNDHLTPEFIRLSCLLGWSVEMVNFPWQIFTLTFQITIGFPLRWPFSDASCTFDHWRYCGWQCSPTWKAVLAYAQISWFDCRQWHHDVFEWCAFDIEEVFWPFTMLFEYDESAAWDYNDFIHGRIAWCAIDESGRSTFYHGKISQCVRL